MDGSAKAPAAGPFFAAPLMLAAAFALAATLAASRAAPVGFDAEEYSLVARTLIERGEFSVAGLHATLYPPVASLLAAALLRSGFLIWPGFGGLNLLCFAGVCIGLYGYFSRRKASWAGLAAALLLACNPVALDCADTVGSDLPSLLLIALLLLISIETEISTPGRIALTVLLLTLAALTRTAALAIAGAPVAAILIATWPQNCKRRASAFVGAAACILIPLAATILFALFERRYGPHPADYLRSFFQVDPNDAAQGILKWSGVAKRTLAHVPRTVHFASEAIMADVFGKFAGIVLSTILIGAALLGDRKRGAILLAGFVPYMTLVLVWPYDDPRFSLPLALVAAIGLGNLWKRIEDQRRSVALATISATIALFAVLSLFQIYSASGDRQNQRILVARQLNETAQWIQTNIPASDPIASLDARELASRIPQPLRPLGYTTDPAAIRAAAGPAKWLVASSAFGATRNNLSNSDEKALVPGGQPAYENKGFRVWKLDSPGVP